MEKVLNNVICHITNMSVKIHKNKDEDLGMLQMQVLWLLEKEPDHGYSLMKKLSEIKSTKIEQGTLYPLLQKLESNGYIEIKDTGTRGRKIYRITKNGRAVMRRSCEDFIFTFDNIIEDYKCKKCEGKNCVGRK
jgi:DNA-binding PadR family transcriptional regulator